MAGRTFQYQGATYEVQADGSARKVPTRGAVPVGPPNPLMPGQVAGQEFNNRNTQAQTGRTVVQTRGDEIDNATKAATQQAMIAKARAEAQKAAADAVVAQRGANNPVLSDEQRKAAMQAGNLDALVGQINRVQDLYDQNIAGASPFEWLPGRSDMAQFNAASAGLAEQGLGAFRTPGIGSQSDAELRQFVEANKPHSSSLDSANEERLRQLRARTDAARKALGLTPAQWGGAGSGIGGMVGARLSPPPRKASRGWWEGDNAPRKAQPIDDEVMSYINRARGGR